MFYCLAASLNYAFKWISMFDQDQMFSPNSLPHEQMFGHLATSANKACTSRKKVTNQGQNLDDLTYFSRGNKQKDYHMGLLCPFSHQTVCVSNTMFDHLHVAGAFGHLPASLLYSLITHFSFLVIVM